ncbi:MAG: D-alanyl-D-alanine carboxypeptidase/D-alanyl-D-alanine-endopeptidase [Muribaculaceae bacterium]|nr:D-alanyl-D-alanine carboxypeptidase/D-alanyl-D-alanine-endopeptidase [Muribaculaceae bacterium]
MNPTKPLWKRAMLLPLFILFAFLPAPADAIGDFVASPAINAPAAAVFICDLKTGEEMAAHNIDIPLVPASIMKSVTIATLLEKVGPRYRYLTPVYVQGTVSDGVLDGNLVVKASGDPSVNTRHAPGSEDITAEISDALKAFGITRITGQVKIDESGFPGPAVNPAWAQGDLQHSYGTGTHGFNFEDNASGKRAVHDPAGVFRTRLKAALAKAGITIGGATVNVDGPETMLGQHQSETIDDVMRSCMMRSDNQYAEAFLRLVGKTYGKEGSTAEGASQLMRHWRDRKANLDGVKVVDGSGLSRSNRITARFMADVLTKMAGNPYYASFFPLAGQEGTLRSLLKTTPLEGRIAMKTGSMNGIQCYAGYKLDDDYTPTHVVVVMMNDMGNRAAARRQVERLLLRTFTNETDINVYDNETDQQD